MKKVTILSTVLLLSIAINNDCFAQNPNVPEGAIGGLFSVSNTKQVWFSKGNLQYQASTNTWRFATNQWDFVGGTTESRRNFGNVSGSSNNNISQTYDGWIDLFCWGTSGYKHGPQAYYQPWSTDDDYGRYWVYGHYSNNLYDQTGQADWGYNAISNGGNQNNVWRTLTAAEWNYLINERTTSSGYRFAKARVNQIAGIILFPDNWVAETFPINKENNQGFTFEVNTITEADWNILEAQGAVFLPITGLRGRTFNTPTHGHYWSSSIYNESNAKSFTFGVNGIGISNDYRYYGLAVRLVQNYTTE